MTTARDPGETAWDQLLDLIDHLAAAPERPLPEDLESQLAALCHTAVRDGSIDRELHPADIARWLPGLLNAHRSVRAAHPAGAPDDDLAVLRVIVTRWLHPPRLGS